MEKEKVIEAIKKLREGEKRKFSQSVDLIMNLKNFDAKKDSVNLFLSLPHKIREPKIFAFLNSKNNFVESMSKDQFEFYKDKKKIKKLVKEHDFFIASGNLMPAVAAAFGKYLGTSGKMPSPQLGIITQETEHEIKNIMAKFEKVVRIKSKEPSLKFSVAKESMKDDEIADNILAAYNTIANALVKKKENIKSVMIKFTMGKPVRIE